MRTACCITKATNKHTLRICNTYYFSTTTTVTGTRLAVTLKVHFLSCLFCLALQYAVARLITSSGKTSQQSCVRRYSVAFDWWCHRHDSLRVGTCSVTQKRENINVQIYLLNVCIWRKWYYSIYTVTFFLCLLCERICGLSLAVRGWVNAEMEFDAVCTVHHPTICI